MLVIYAANTLKRLLIATKNKSFPFQKFLNRKLLSVFSLLMTLSSQVVFMTPCLSLDSPFLARTASQADSLPTDFHIQEISQSIESLGVYF